MTVFDPAVFGQLVLDPDIPHLHNINDPVQTGHRDRSRPFLPSSLVRWLAWLL